MRRRAQNVSPAVLLALLTAAGLAAIAPGGVARAAGDATPASATPTAASPADAAAAWKQMALLQGTWKGVSQGRQETATIRLIADGSVLSEESQDADDPAGKKRMNTMYQLDGPRLLATHYCVTGSTPRLVATNVDGAGQAITFTFLDAVNLPSRSHGHMDKVVVHFVDADHFTEHWTWYEEGKESWMEEIRFERAR